MEGQGASMPSSNATLTESPRGQHLEALDKAVAGLRGEMGWRLSLITSGQGRKIPTLKAHGWLHGQPAPILRYSPKLISLM